MCYATAHINKGENISRNGIFCIEWIEDMHINSTLTLCRLFTMKMMEFSMSMEFSVEQRDILRACFTHYSCLNATVSFFSQPPLIYLY